MAGSADRLAMCRLAVADDPAFEVNDLELRRGGPSYTIDTLAELAHAGAGRVSWLIGADMLMYLPHWHRPLEVLAAVNFVVMARPGWKLDWATLPVPYQQLQQNLVEAPLIDISSSQIRQRIAHRKSIAYLTPNPVCAYIEEHQLYQSNKSVRQ